jgi:hypothetical protein
VFPTAGKSADPAVGYEWAVVTAGAHGHRLLNGKCRTGDALGNYQGKTNSFDQSAMLHL